MECKRCGLETDGGYSHRNVDRCLDVTMEALRREKTRTSRAVRTEDRKRIARLESQGEEAQRVIDDQGSRLLELEAMVEAVREAVR